jgi:acyl-coenzyme A synthetase/AMP-(fatty) acid ligase
MTSAVKLALTIAACALIGFALWMLFTGFDPLHMRRNAEAKAQAATQSADLATATGQTIERTYHTETVIREKGDTVVETINAAPSASDALPPDIRDAVIAGVASLRDDAKAADDHGSGNAF